MIVLFDKPAARVLPSGLNSKPYGMFSSAFNEPSNLWAATSHNTMLPSLKPAASMRPSGLNVTFSTPAPWLVGTTASCVREGTSHKRSLPPESPDAKVLPSGSKDNHQT